jgi:Transposase DDE domain
LPVWDINTAKVLLAKIILSANYNPVLRAQENRSYLKQKGIHFAGKPLGRPKIVTEENRDELKQLKTQRRTDYLQRIPIEGKFGQGKKGYRLNYTSGANERIRPDCQFRGTFRLPLAPHCTDLSSLIFIVNPMTRLIILMAWFEI